ncbi:hypothetical protein H4R33_007185 [Dimargaris cristalligena]|nr:hypothetical protein H4R33_007185 [Dimargaris cristalligena]
MGYGANCTFPELALANLAAEEFGRNPYYAARIELYTYGQPRIGNKKFVKHFNKMQFKDVRRVTNGRDVIPVLLPKWWSYRNFNQEYYICPRTHETFACDLNNAMETKFGCRSQKHTPSARLATHHLMYWDIKFWKYVPTSWADGERDLLNNMVPVEGQSYSDYPSPNSSACSLPEIGMTM